MKSVLPSSIFDVQEMSSTNGHEGSGVSQAWLRMLLTDCLSIDRLQM